MRKPNIMRAPQMILVEALALIASCDEWTNLIIIKCCVLREFVWPIRPMDCVRFSFSCVRGQYTRVRDCAEVHFLVSLFFLFPCVAVHHFADVLKVWITLPGMFVVFTIALLPPLGSNLFCFSCFPVWKNLCVSHFFGFGI